MIPKFVIDAYHVFAAMALILLPWFACSNKIDHISARFRSFSNFCTQSQNSIIASLEKEDGRGKFLREPWERFATNGDIAGYGVTAVIEKGDMVEKGAVSTTFLTGHLSKERASAISSRKSKWKELVNENAPYYAAAMSLVLHSKSPMIPTFRADIRYFELAGGVGWFGGGGDLTPYYLFDEDVKHFHSVYQDVCDQHSSSGASGAPGSSREESMYQSFKRCCDEYFYIPARREHRGVGGIFFDDLDSLREWKHSSRSTDSVTEKSGSSISNSSYSSRVINSDEELDEAMSFTCDVSNAFMRSYLPIVRNRRSLPYTPEQRHWQLLRRGRYIEFNLLYDRGVRFGLVPGGRTEAVLVSCPPLVAWDYNHQPEPNSEEARLMEVLRIPKEWVPTDTQFDCC